MAETGLTSKKQRTLDYWWQLRRHVLCCDLKKGDKPEQVAAKLDRVIAAVDELPTLGVDLDAVNCSLDISAAFSSMSRYIKGNSGDGRLVEAFVRGFLGDPFGVANEVAAEQKTVAKQIQAAADRCKRARAVLTDRYGIEFPKID